MVFEPLGTARPDSYPILKSAVANVNVVHDESWAKPVDRGPNMNVAAVNKPRASSTVDDPLPAAVPLRDVRLDVPPYGMDRYGSGDPGVRWPILAAALS